MPTRLLALQVEAVAAYVRHARHPERVGADAAHRKRWVAAYEARAALAEQNPVFAQTLLPLGSGVALPNALPVVPAGVLWQVDQLAPGTLTVSVDVAGGFALTVSPPVGPAFAAVITPGLTRATATFPALADGLYALALTVGGLTLTTLWVPVSRGAFALLREDSRALAFAFRAARPAPSEGFAERLACLIGCEAAARTGQPALALAMQAAARALPAAPTPIGIYPLRSC